MVDFIEITFKDDIVTSKMPADETVVEVRMTDGSTALAWFGCNIMDVGDFDFVPVKGEDDEPDMSANSIADKVVAWRPIEKHPDLFGDRVA